MKKYNCKAPGCSNTIDEPGYCERHSKIKADREAEQQLITLNRFINLSKAGKELFNTREWRTLRKRLLQEHPYCELCGGVDCLEIHHRVKHKGNPYLFFNSDNLQVLCKECHREISMQQIRNKE